MTTTDDIIRAAEKRLLELKPAVDEAERLRAVIAAAKGEQPALVPQPALTLSPQQLAEILEASRKILAPGHPIFWPVPAPYPQVSPYIFPQQPLRIGDWICGPIDVTCGPRSWEPADIINPPDGGGVLFPKNFVVGGPERPGDDIVYRASGQTTWGSGIQ